MKGGMIFVVVFFVFLTLTYFFSILSVLFDVEFDFKMVFAGRPKDFRRV